MLQLIGTAISGAGLEPAAGIHEKWWCPYPPLSPWRTTRDKRVGFCSVDARVR